MKHKMICKYSRCFCPYQATMMAALGTNQQEDQMSGCVSQTGKHEIRITGVYNLLGGSAVMCNRCLYMQTLLPPRNSKQPDNDTEGTNKLRDYTFLCWIIISLDNI